MSECECWPSGDTVCVYCYDKACAEARALNAELVRVKQECAELDAAMKEVTGKLLNQMVPGLRELDQAKEAGALSALETAAFHAPEYMRESLVTGWMQEWRTREAKHE